MEVAERRRSLESQEKVIGFNGAATWKSRKERSRCQPCYWQRSFNGAATWKSRKVNGRSGRLNWPMGLQWSRDLEVAESGLARGYSSSSSCFNGAATWKSRKAPSGLRSTSISTRFNGAATWKSRKVGFRCQHLGRLRASMEPRIGSRGKALNLPLYARAEEASMEPRLGSRGKSLSEVPPSRPQWPSMEPRLGSRGKGVPV